MPALLKVNITHLRNIEAQSVKPTAGINILFGENGSGKTSILEGIHLLGMARSFRSNQGAPLIQFGETDCTVYGELDNGLTLGITKAQNQAQQIRISGRKAANAAELAWKLPVQLLNSDTFKLLEGRPGIRRKYLDWGVFHVEHRFFPYWQQFQRALRHRNHLLRQNAGKDELAPWTAEFAKKGSLIDQCRQEYLARLLPLLREVLGQLRCPEDLSLKYDQGWPEALALPEFLDAALERDLKYGYTVHGPHRADLKIAIGAGAVVDILSRGQQKMLVCGLKLAQGALLQRETKKRCIYLIDDLPAELDENNRAMFCRAVEQLESQVFLTTVERSALDASWQNTEAPRMFHVKHGKILPCSAG